MDKILLLISENDCQDLFEKLVLELAPSRSVVLCPDNDSPIDNCEFRKLPSENQDNTVLQNIRELSDVFNSELICCFTGNAGLAVTVAHAMGLGAAYKDRLCHVQIEPFEISDIPFTRLSYLYQDRLNRLPENYADTIELANLRVSRHIDTPELFMTADPFNCIIGKCELPLNREEFILYWLLATRCKNEVTPLHGEDELLDEFQAFVESTLSTIMPAIIEIRETLLEKSADDILKLVADLSKKIKSNIAFDNGLDCALPIRDHGIYGISFPHHQVTCPRNY